MQYFNNSIVEENGARFDLSLTLAIAHKSYFLDHVCISLALSRKLPVEIKFKVVNYWMSFDNCNGFLIISATRVSSNAKFIYRTRFVLIIVSMRKYIMYSTTPTHNLQCMDDYNRRKL